MTVRIAEQRRIDPSQQPLRDAHDHLIGIGDHVVSIFGADLGTVIGRTHIAEDEPLVRSERGPLHITYATPPEQLEVTR